MMPLKARARFWIVVGFFIALSALAYSIWRMNHVPAVDVHRVTRGELAQTVVASGRVRAVAKIGVGPQIGGTVAQLAVREGDAVRTGQTLLLLEDAEARAAVAEARAGVEQAEARLNLLREVSSKVAAESLRQAHVNLQQAERDYTRLEGLARDGLVTASELEASRRTLELARSQQQSASIQQESTSASGSETQQALANRSQSQAQLQAAETRLAYTRVVAPTDGVILSHSVETGDIVQGGQPVLVLARKGETELVVEPDEKNLAFLKLGQRALASADAFPDNPFAAEVAFIAPGIDMQRGTIEMRLSVSHPPDYLKPDMTVSVEVEVGRRKDALLLGLDCLHDIFSRKPWVLAVRDGRIERVEVKIGLRTEMMVEIAEGLAEGELVIPTTAGEFRIGELIIPRLVEVKQ
jgi:HlyD family secretion protein